MARPINPYQGPAPAAMSQMGAGLLEAGANIGRTLAAGYESMGKGIAGGITSAASSIADYYKQNKEAQARFDATKKMFKAFESFLEPSQREAIQGIFDDTTISTAQKNEFAPMLMNFLGQSQAQAGRKQIAEIMAGSKLDVANLKNKPPVPYQPFNVGSPESELKTVIFNQPTQQVVPSNAPSQASGDTRVDPITGKMQFFDKQNKRWIDEPEDEVMFDQNLKMIK